MKPVRWAVGIGLAVACCGCGNEGVERRAANCITDGAPITELTPGQKQRVLELLARDPTLEEVLGASTYRVRSVGAWTTAGSLELEGGVVELSVTPPAQVEGVRVPSTVQPHAGAPDPDPCLRYLQRSAVADAENVTQIRTLVDLSEAAVVQIEPGGPDSEVRYSDESGEEPSDAYDAPPGY